MTTSTNPESLSFPSREAYVAWRQQMRDTYKTLSTSIRTNKQSIGADARKGTYTGDLQNKLIGERVEAAYIMSLRTEAKALARAAHAARFAHATAA